MSEKINGQMPAGGAALSQAQQQVVGNLRQLLTLAEQGAFDAIAFAGVGGPYGNLTLSCNPERICELWMGLDLMKDQFKAILAQAAQQAAQKEQQKRPAILRASGPLPPFPGKALS